MKKALITGITGQDGSYLAEFLLYKNYEVHGLIRRSSTFNTSRIDHLYVDPHTSKNFFLHYGDLSDASQLTNIIFNIKPDEIYHLGAQSHVKVSFEMPEYTGDITALGTTRLLEAVRRSGIKTKIYQASSSEMFGTSSPPQNEDTQFKPASPYAVSKVYAYGMSQVYREGYGIFIANGILFNHESVRRGETFVTRKITRAVANILARKQDKLYLGSLKAKRDWGFAPEYVEMMWRILQEEKPTDFCIGTGKSYTVLDFLKAAFSYVDLDWHDYVEIDPRYYRPIDPGELRADTRKAQDKLNWKVRIDFEALIKIMLDYDLELVGLTPRGDGKKILRDNFEWVRDDLWIKTMRGK